MIIEESEYALGRCGDNCIRFFMMSVHMSLLSKSHWQSFRAIY